MSEKSSLPLRMGFFGGLPPLARQGLIWFAIVFAAFLVGWIGRGVLAGPADVATVSVYDNWRLGCPDFSQKDATCEMSLDVYDNASHQQFARLVFGKQVDRDKHQSYVLMATVPLEVALQRGLSLRVGGDTAHVYQFKTCTETGCVSIIPVDKQMEASMRGAQEMGLTLVFANGRQVDLPFSNKGFVEARDAFRDNDAKRGSWWWRLWS